MTIQVVEIYYKNNFTTLLIQWCMYCFADVQQLITTSKKYISSEVGWWALSICGERTKFLSAVYMKKMRLSLAFLLIWDLYCNHCSNWPWLEICNISPYCLCLLKPKAIIAGITENPAAQIFFIHFSIDNSNANISLYT